MDISEIISHLNEIPTWAWIVIAIVIIFFFGDRKKWEYEVNLSYQQGVGHGEVEIECVGKKVSQKDKKYIEAELTLEPASQNKAYEVLLNGTPVLSIPASRTGSSRVFIRKPYTGSQPRKGDKIEVQCDNRTVLSSLLHED